MKYLGASLLLGLGLVQSGWAATFTIDNRTFTLPDGFTIEKIAGHINTTIRSPRPSGPKAQALSKLVITPDDSIRALVLKTSLIFRSSID